MKRPIDIHAHYSPEKLDGRAVISLSVGRENPSPQELLQQHPDLSFSIGLHPWEVEADWEERILRSVAPLVHHPQVVAVGEAGLDRLRGGKWEWQVGAFRLQAQLAAEAGLPLVVHCVKAFEELVSLYKSDFKGEQWIIHGFRGKAEQAGQLLRQGFSLSFGEHYHEEALRLCPPDRLFIETDESRTDIGQLYARAARIRGVTVGELQLP